MEGETAAAQAPKSVEEKETESPQPASDVEVNGASADAADAAAAGSDEPQKSVPRDDATEDEREYDSMEDEPQDASKEDASQDEETPEPESKAEKEASPSAGGADAKPDTVARGRRVRKSTEQYTVKEMPKKDKEIPDGKGVKLAEMPNVVANFEAITWSDPHLRVLHSIVFGVGKKKEFKGRLLQFNGVVYPEGKKESEQDKFLAKMYKLKMDELKAVMDLADVDRSAAAEGGSEKGTVNKPPGKEALCDRFLAWLEDPKASGKEPGKKKGKRKSSGSSGKGSAKKATPAKKAKRAAPAKTTSAKKARSSAKKSAKSTPKSPKTRTTAPVFLDIPGADIDKVRAKVSSIVERADKAELTVKGVRKLLEEWLDTDLTDHKDAVRSLVMEVM